jgi:hypothetical protein
MHLHSSLMSMEILRQNLGRVFNSRCGRARLRHAVMLITETAKLKVENPARITFSLSPVKFHADTMTGGSFTVR